MNSNLFKITMQITYIYTYSLKMSNYYYRLAVTIHLVSFSVMDNIQWIRFCPLPLNLTGSYLSL